MKAAAPKKKEGASKKEETKIVLTVMRTTHGFLFGRHSHYHPSLVEVSKSTYPSTVRKIAEEAAKTATQVLNQGKVDVIVCEEIAVRTREDASAAVKKFIDLIKE